MNILLFLLFFVKVHLEESTHHYHIALIIWASVMLCSLL
jgi:hypothetical protein